MDRIARIALFVWLMLLVAIAACFGGLDDDPSISE